MLLPVGSGSDAMFVSEGPPVLRNGQQSRQHTRNVIRCSLYKATDWQRFSSIIAICIPKILPLPIAMPLCDEGLLGVTNLRPETGRWSLICPEALNSEPQDYPETQEERLYDFISLAWSEKHVDFYSLSRVGSMLHKIHHAPVPNRQIFSPPKWSCVPILSDEIPRPRHGTGNSER